MREMETQRLTAYLKHLAALEASAYRQKRELDTAREEFERRRPDKPEPWRGNAPQKIDLTGRMGEPVEPVPPGELSGLERVQVLIPLWVIGGILTELSGMALLTGSFLIGLLLWLISVVLIVLAFVSMARLKKRRRAKVREHEARVAAYEQEHEAYLLAHEEWLKSTGETRKEMEAEVERIFAEETARYEQRRREHDEAAAAEYQAALARHDAVADTVLSQMELRLGETREALDQLYGLEVIIPQYRDLVPIGMICEYISSGRCSGLTGPEGAYSLYESELRKNVITDRPEALLARFDQGNDNPSVLYNELKDMDQAMRQITDDVALLTAHAEVIAETTQGVAIAAHITAESAKIEAQNTEALAYLASA